MPPTLSILQCNRPAAMNRESSLKTHVVYSIHLIKHAKFLLVYEFRRDTKRLSHVVQRKRPVTL